MISTFLSFWENITFLWPWMLAFLPLPWLIRRIWKPAEQRQVPLLAPHIMQRLSGSLNTKKIFEPSKKTARIPIIFLLLWILLILTSMRPVWFLTPTTFTVTGKDIILAVDLSGSMEKKDMMVAGEKVDRLVAVKHVVEEFIQQREGDRLGLIVFGTQAFIQSPLTHDLNTVQTLLSETAIGMAGNNTAIGDAIGLTLKHLNAIQSTQRADKTVLILLTDGSNTAGVVQPIEAAKKAKQAGLKIYTIGIGQVRHRQQGLLSNLSSRDMDIASLQKIADLTQGQFFHATDTRQLNAIYQTISQLESTEYEINHFRLRTELYIWPLGGFLILSFFIASFRLFNFLPLWVRK